MTEKDKVTRIEVISDKGREYVNRHVKNIRLSIQDDGRTLKIFYDENLQKELS